MFLNFSFSKKILALFSAVLVIFVAEIPFVRAAQFSAPVVKDVAYSGKYVSQSILDPIVFSPGETKQLNVVIKNTGTATWQAVGSNYVSVYTVGPNYRPSVFYNTQWLAKNNPTKLEKVTKPQENATFKISLTAPTKTGEYMERFWLAAENKTWIKGSGFYFKIKIISAATTSPDSGSSFGKLATTSYSNSGYKAEALAPTPTYIQSGTGEDVRVILDFKNSGTAAWQSYLLKEVSTLPSRGDITGLGTVSVADTSWVSPSKIVEGNSVVNPGEILQAEFSLQTPPKPGEYLTQFELVIDGRPLPGGTVNLPILISSDVATTSSTSSVVSTPPSNSNRELIAEPTIRVGLYKTDGPVQFKSDFSYQIYSGDELKGTTNLGEVVELNYSGGTYSYKGSGLDFSSSNYLRLVPQDPANYFTLVNYERKLNGRSTNFNMYRGTLEFKYSSKSALPYVINELPLDEYVAGVAETSNSAPVEYNKALIVAERSYAYYHLSRSAASPGKNLFDVSPTTADQLYLGYNSEVLMPKVVVQTQSTYGEMVTYNGKPVVTPYYSRSDGRTRSWKEVWGGDYYPWLQSVEAIYDKGKTMLGHGVGMSGSDALKHAGNDGWTYDQILKYYYTGTEVEKIY